MNRRIPRLLPAMMVIIALSSCASPVTGDPDSQPSVGTIRPLTDYRSIVLPMDPYLAVIEAWSVPDKAINIIGRQCMKRFGLDWPIVPADTDQSAEHRYARRYGFIDPHEAARSGYHAEPPRGSDRDGDRSSQVRDPTPDEMAVWAGRGPARYGGVEVPPGGCAGEAIRTLATGAPSPPTVNPNMLANEAYSRAEQDPRMIEVFTSWSDCMRTRGFQYDRPSEASNDPRWSGSVASESEIATAVADVACKQRTNLAGTWFALETAYQKRLIDENSAALGELRLYYETIARNAAKVVGQ